MGWDGHHFGIFYVSTDSHGGERERIAEQKLEELREDIRNFVEEMEHLYNIPGIIQLYPS